MPAIPISIWSLALSFLWGVATAQDVGKGEPALRFERFSHDFGKVSDAEPVVATIAFRNAHRSRTITILEIKTSCGCLTAKVDDRVLAPGADRAVELVYNPQGRQGKDRKGIVLVTDDPKAMKIELTIDVEVEARLWIEPMSIHLGEIRHDSIAKRRPASPITVTARDADFAVKSARLLDPSLTLRDLGVETVGRGAAAWRRYRYEVVADRDLPIGRIETRFVMETNDPKKPELVVAITLIAVGELMLSQEPIHLRMTKEGAVVSREFNLTSRNARAFEVKRAYVTGCEPMTFAVQCIPVAQNGRSRGYLVRLTGVTPPPPTFVTGRLVFETDLSSQPRYEVPLTGAVPLPALRAVQESRPASAPADQRASLPASSTRTSP